VFWNGKNSLYDGAEALTQKVTDNYKEVLRVYNYGTMQEAQSLNSQMDRAIEKASIGIQRHSMYFGGKEYIKWVKVSYLMMGQAHFYKQDYTSARRVFDFVSKQYSDDPIQYEGYLWLAKTYIETERFEKADAVINYLQSKKDESNFPRKVTLEMPFVIADYYLAQKKYNDAYPYLERCLEVGNKRDIITRVDFILGQINQLEGDLEKASYYYNRVIKRNADYRMAFEAKMNLAKSYDETSGDSKAIVKTLQKMAKEYKNRDFLDQIYFALGEIAMKDGNKELAIEYYAQSVTFSRTNNYQKSESALTLAEIYFDEYKYELSQAYYDTAVSFLPQDFPDYDKIKNKASVLTDLVKLASTIKVQDSLLNLAGLDTTKLYAIIDRVIEQKIKDREQEEEMAADGGIQFADIGQKSRNPNIQPGKWYFYNTAALSYGYSEFIKKWGNRKLEDNWRLSDKRLVMQSYGDDTAEGDLTPADSALMVEENNPEKRAYYLKEIPFKEEQKKASKEQIMKSYKDLGFLYLEDLRDTANALNTYLDLQEKYPDNPYRLEAWYALYKIYDDEGNTEQAAYYKSKIISNYPDSNYAKIISDPDYYIKLAEGNTQALDLYEKTYKAFNRGQYFRVITYANKGIEAYPDDTALVPRFMYLRAISLGKVDVPDTLYASLKELVTEYPSSPVVSMANAVLNALSSQYGIGEPVVEGGNAADSTDQGIPDIYEYDENTMHLVMVIVNSKNVKIDPLKVRLSDFKKKSFRLLNVRIKSLMLDSYTTLITIGNFGNKREAEKFYSALKADDYVFSGLNPDDFNIVTISINNYPVFYKAKDVDGYLRFFEKYYENSK
jgi:tetratricopeptide (TPR) repeat protein